MYFVKNLEHINRWINWTKAKYPKIEFVQVPHWNLTYILRGGMYCVPNPKVKLLKLADVVKAMQLTYGLYYTFLGMKKADGMNLSLIHIWQDEFPLEDSAGQETEMPSHENIRGKEYYQ